MRLLLDTCAFLWWLSEDPKLSPRARRAVSDPAALVYVSPASLWEIAIKASLGKLDTGGGDLVHAVAANGFHHLPITARHAWAAGALPRHHDDPFDRMLIAQARIEALTVVTCDEAFGVYGVATLAA